MQQALACLSRGDNACVIQALENKAASADEIELLVATYRSLGDVPKATREMHRYLERFPTGRRAGEYDLVLQRQSGEPAPKASESPGSTSAP
ncbi:MAG: hypothetical protein ACHQ53_12060 [Polyangiales bacterium]